MKGCVYKIHSDFYYVKPENGFGEELATCKLRDVLKKQKTVIKVGDFIEFENGAIYKLLERKNTVPRPNVANIDLAVVTSSLKDPEIDFIQLNRYLIFLKYHKIPCLLCFNKDDLLNEEEFKAIENKINSIYLPLGYKTVFTSAILNDGIEDFKKLIKDKTIVFCGLSGVGKSSILNAITNKNARTGDISQKNRRGCHTTRHCEIIETDDMKIMDTPGFSRLSFDFILPKDLAGLFDEINELKKGCKYSDCLHEENDEECNVIKNLDKIDKTRYESYLNFLKEAKEYKQKVLYESQKEETTVKFNQDKEYTKINTKKRNLSRRRIKQNTKNLHFEGASRDND